MLAVFVVVGQLLLNVPYVKRVNTKMKRQTKAVIGVLQIRFLLLEA